MLKLGFLIVMGAMPLLACDGRPVYTDLPSTDSNHWEEAVANLPLDRLIDYNNREVEHSRRDVLFIEEIGKRGELGLVSLIDAMAVRGGFAQLRQVSDLMSADRFSHEETQYSLCLDEQLRHRINRLIEMENGVGAANVTGLTGFVDRVCDFRSTLNTPIEPVQHAISDDEVIE